MQSRNFGTFGAGATDRVTTTFCANATGPRAYAIWAWMNDDGGSNTGRFFEKTESTAVGSERFNTNGAVPRIEFFRDFSTTDGQWSLPRPTLQRWHFYVINYDQRNVGNDPEMWIDYVRGTVTEISTPAGTPVSGAAPFLIGNRGDSARVTNGGLYRFAIWDRFLLAPEIAGLYSGLSPMVYPSALVYFEPLNGHEERWGGAPPTVTGTRAGTQGLGVARPDPYLERWSWFQVKPAAGTVVEGTGSSVGAATVVGDGGFSSHAGAGPLIDRAPLRSLADGGLTS